MLQNEPSVAKIGVDTAENEPIFGWIQLVQLSRFNSSILSLMHTYENRVDLATRQKMFASIGVDRAESGPSRAERTENGPLQAVEQCSELRA